MALTKISGGVINTNTSITAVGATFSGNVSVAGTLTYEDVTNIDSVGLITARSGIEFGTRPGLGASISDIGNAVFAGVVTATSYYGDGSNLTGIDATQIVTGNTSVQTVDTGSDGHIKFNTEGSERGRFDNSGRLLLGTSTSANIGGGTAINQIFSNSNGEFVSLHLGYSASAGGSPVLALSRSRNTSYGSYTVVQSGDSLGRIRFTGDDGSDYDSIAALIETQVDGTPGTNDMPGRLVFSTTADGAASPTERMRIHSTGQVEIKGGAFSVAMGGSGYQTIFRSGANEDNFITQGASGFTVFRNHNATEHARFDSSGYLLVGRTTTQNENIGGTGYANLVQIEGNGTGQGLSVANSADAARINITRDIASDSITNNMDLGFISFGAESPTSVERARIMCNAEFTNANERGGRLVFYTSGDGNHVPEERLRIANTGAFGLSGANYGTSGQVLTSQGSGSAPQWATPLSSGSTNTYWGGGSTEVDFLNIPSTANFITISFNNLNLGNGPVALYMRLFTNGSSTVDSSSTYCMNCTNVVTSTQKKAYKNISSLELFPVDLGGLNDLVGAITLTKMGTHGYSITGTYGYSTANSHNIVFSGSMLKDSIYANGVKVFSSTGLGGGRIAMNYI